MSFCPKCGKELASGAKFCGGCGTALGAESATSGAVTGERLRKPWVYALIAVVAVVVIGGLVMLGGGAKKIGEFILASQRAKMSEVSVVFASFESAYLAAVAEMGDDKITKDYLVFEVPTSKLFTYEISENASSCKAVAKTNIGDFKKGDYIITTYDRGFEAFIHRSNNKAARDMIPRFFQNGLAEIVDDAGGIVGKTTGKTAQSHVTTTSAEKNATAQSILPAKLNIPKVDEKLPQKAIRIWGWSENGKIAFSTEYTEQLNDIYDFHPDYYILDLTSDTAVFKYEFASVVNSNGITVVSDYDKNNILKANAEHNIVYSKTTFSIFPLSYNGSEYDCEAIVKFVQEDMSMGARSDIVTTVKNYNIVVTRSDGKKKSVASDTLYTGDFHYYNALKVIGYVRSPYENRIAIITALGRDGMGYETEWIFNGCKLDIGFK